MVVGTHLMKWATYQVEYNRVDTINNHELSSSSEIPVKDNNYITLDENRSEGGFGNKTEKYELLLIIYRQATFPVPL